MEKTPQAKRGGIHNLKHYPMKYFKITEFFRSDVADKYQVSNMPADEELYKVLPNIIALASNILVPLRAMLDYPIIITSGYRSQKVNELVGGSKTSQHLLGQAADIHVQGFTPEQMGTVYDIIQTYFDFDQLIFYPHKNIIHVSWNEGKNRKESWVEA